VIESPLWNSIVINLAVLHEGGLQLCRRSKASLLEYLADATIKPLNHTVSLRMARWDQSVFNVVFSAGTIKSMLTSRNFVFAGKAICKLVAIVGQYFANFDRRSVF
jgi:hypothetical protein